MDVAPDADALNELVTKPQVVKGWHARPGKETVTSPLMRTASSITLRNGACPISKHARRSTSTQPTSVHNKSDQRANTNLPTTTNTVVDPKDNTTTYSLAAMHA